MKAILALEDGSIFRGEAFGSSGEKSGEVVFNTSMTGYQEVLTDPSYRGQIVTMTYPLIGNYGINDEDTESSAPQVEGFVIKELSGIESNWRATQSLSAYLSKHNIIGIQGIDTRALTKHIRTAGAMKAVLSTEDFDEKRLVKKAKQSPGLVGVDMVKEVTCKKPYSWRDISQKLHRGTDSHKTQDVTYTHRVVALDCGIKYSILRLLAESGCDIIVMPAETSSEKILSLSPDGLFISNGPGDPAPLSYIVDTVQDLIGKLPIFGICLGHQILGLAFGGKTYKLKFGHRGGNQPVIDLATGKVDITCQNHGFCVDSQTVNSHEIFLTHINLNDKTLEGMSHKKYPIFSVQYHPESSPGPHDAQYLFKHFVKYMEL